MSDTKLEELVGEQLSGDASINSYRIKIQADGDDVLLSGLVDSLHEKRRAAADAARLTGVHRVRNELIVDKTHKRVPDADLRATAQAGLDANGLVPKDKLTVSVSDGWIMIGGNVGHYYQREAAEHVITHLSGVQGLTNNVTVSKDPNQDVSNVISAALTRDAFVDAMAIKVIDADGAVTLSGTVKTYAEKQEAERAAASAPGVVSVTNNLVVAG